VNRTLATIIEQHHDNRGIIWPVTVAPFQVWLMSLGKSDEEVRLAEEIYGMVRGAGIEVLYDDRKLSPGFKFGDADMVGSPVRVTVGKSYFQNGEIEVKLRSSDAVDKVKKEDIIRHLEETLAREAARYAV
jgi:prolyl-tRNA synthetase